ncbi:DedA family protein [Baekduia soli]|uniref:DedA family protein n=1 Tax=Baekduia soli TaxID=496014 RepID=A0A5B8U1D0_9ACTN|nr:DedA family protein [Baekduia soli]QEC46874.1 DedA family protein [Baekduia soli]
MLLALLVLASVTDKLADFATRVVGDLGLPGIFLLMVPESACIPIPSEATMLFAGFNVSEGKYSLFAAVAVGSVANLVGSWIAYAVGYYGRLELLERHRVFHVRPEHLALTERWFQRWGAWAVFFSRMLPIVRTFISLPAGVARMPFWRFSVLTLAGCVPWILMLTLVGKAARDNWDVWKDRLHYVDYAVAVLIVLGIVWLLQRWWRGRRARPATDAA